MILKKKASKVCVYSILHNVCNRICISEISRIIKKCIYEHIQDFKSGDFHNALVKHNSETKQF